MLVQISFGSRFHHLNKYSPQYLPWCWETRQSSQGVSTSAGEVKQVNLLQAQTHLLFLTWKDLGEPSSQIISKRLRVWQSFKWKSWEMQNITSTELLIESGSHAARLELPYEDEGWQHFNALQLFYLGALTQYNEADDQMPEWQTFEAPFWENRFVRCSQWFKRSDYTVTEWKSWRTTAVQVGGKFNGVSCTSENMKKQADITADRLDWRVDHQIGIIISNENRKTALELIEQDALIWRQ